jgi:uncharacterized protein with PQ loop repeat
LQVLIALLPVILYIPPAYSTIRATVAEAGIQVDVVVIIVVAWAVWLAYAVAMACNSVANLRKKSECNPVKFNRVFPFITIILFSLVYTAVPISESMSLGSINQMLGFEGLLTIIELNALLVLMAGPAVGWFKQYMANGQSNKSKKTWSVILTIGVGAIIVALPYIAIPSNVIPGALPAKPAFVAHRGGGMIGPENTIECAKAIRPYGAIGWEIDVKISYDGVPFLLHDDTFYRTTNVAEVFPGREFEPADSFIWSEIQMLDAGSWFLSDPSALLASQYVSQATLDGYLGAKVPTLAEVINLTEDFGWMVDVDMKGPNADHPHASDYQNTVFNMLFNSSITQIWLGGHFEVLDPRVRHVTSDVDADPATLVSQGYDIICVDLFPSASQLRGFEAAGLQVYAQIVDDVVSFSHSWTAGCAYVLTDSPFLYAAMTTPMWYMPAWAWFASWLATHALVAILVIRAKTKQDLEQ